MRANVTERAVVRASAAAARLDVARSGPTEATAGRIMIPLTIFPLTTPLTTVPVTTLLTVSPLVTLVSTFSTITPLVASPVITPLTISPTTTPLIVSPMTAVTAASPLMTAICASYPRCQSPWARFRTSYQRSSCGIEPPCDL